MVTKHRRSPAKALFVPMLTSVSHKVFRESPPNSRDPPPVHFLTLTRHDRADPPRRRAHELGNIGIGHYGTGGQSFYCREHVVHRRGHGSSLPRRGMTRG
ncbi:hypothetical protein CUAC110523_03855 [Cutibacterium acnes subsp. defendens]